MMLLQSREMSRKIQVVRILRRPTEILVNFFDYLIRYHGVLFSGFILTLIEQYV